MCNFTFYHSKPLKSGCGHLSCPVLLRAKQTLHMTMLDCLSICYRENGDMEYMNALVNELSDQVSAVTSSSNHFFCELVLCCFMAVTY